MTKESVSFYTLSVSSCATAGLTEISIFLYPYSWPIAEDVSYLLRSYSTFKRQGKTSVSGSIRRLQQLYMIVTLAMFEHCSQSEEINYSMSIQITPAWYHTSTTQSSVIRR